MPSYTTIQGDCFDAIAFRLWGNEFLFPALLAANSDYADVLVFPAGVSLNIPQVSLEKLRKSQNMELPPWMTRP